MSLNEWLPRIDDMTALVIAVTALVSALINLLLKSGPIFSFVKNLFIGFLQLLSRKDRSGTRKKLKEDGVRADWRLVILSLLTVLLAIATLGVSWQLKQIDEFFGDKEIGENSDAYDYVLGYFSTYEEVAKEMQRAIGANSDALEDILVHFSSSVKDGLHYTVIDESLNEQADDGFSEERFKKVYENVKGKYVGSLEAVPTVLIESFADSLGSPQYNRMVTLIRAKKVRERIRAIFPEDDQLRIFIVAFGESALDVKAEKVVRLRFVSPTFDRERVDRLCKEKMAVQRRPAEDSAPRDEPEENDIYSIRLVIETSWRPLAGTDALVYFKVGEEEFTLDGEFERENREAFEIELANSIPEQDFKYEEIVIGHDNSRGKAGWKLSSIYMEVAGQDGVFKRYKQWDNVGWISVNKGDRKLAKVLQPKA